MTTSLAGAWRSVRSNIPDYKPGGEWLRFAETGEHVWEVPQFDGGPPVITAFMLVERLDALHLCPIDKVSGVVIPGWPIKFERVAGELVVIPRHGFTTVFELVGDISSPASPA